MRKIMQHISLKLVSQKNDCSDYKRIRRYVSIIYKQIESNLHCSLK